MALFWRAAAAFAAFLPATVAMAADMPVKARPAIVETWNWTGFYIGADVGGAWARTRASTQQLPAQPGAADLQTFDLDGRSVIGGFHAGYNWQVSPTWLIGIEGDFDWTGIKSSVATPLTIGGVPVVGQPAFFGIVGNDAISRNINWLASARVRTGFVAGNWLLYATGGAAWGRMELSALQTVNLLGAPITASATYSASTTRFGYVVGGGVEYALNTNWSLRGEYLFYSLNGTSVAAPAVGVGAVGTFADTFDRTYVHTARVGISYKFGGPVIARY